MKENIDIKKEMKRLKELKARGKQKMTPDRLKTYDGFQNISDELALELIGQMEEYVEIVLKQVIRLDREGKINLSSNDKKL